MVGSRGEVGLRRWSPGRGAGSNVLAGLVVAVVGVTPLAVGLYEQRQASKEEEGTEGTEGAEAAASADGDKPAEGDKKDGDDKKAADKKPSEEKK